MNELMVHVERIVRPVSATQGRKLRMREELLAHLEAAVTEERERSPGDERAAVDRAVARLGEPGKLTQELQESVPAVERVLLGRVSMSPKLEGIERRMGRLPGQRGSMTMGHKLVLSGVATLAYAPVLMGMISFGVTSGTYASPVVCLVGTVTGVLAALFASYWFVFAGAGPKAGGDWRGTLVRGAAVLGTQIGLAYFGAFAIAHRAPTAGDLAMCGGSTLALLLVWVPVSRWVGVLRRPYDRWLTLDVAG